MKSLQIGPTNWKELALFNNKAISKFQMELNEILTNALLARFDYHNLPKGLKTRYIEQKLQLSGGAAIWKNPATNKFWVFNITATKWDSNSDIVEGIIVEPFSKMNGKKLTIDNAVFIYNNQQKSPTLKGLKNVIDAYEKALRELDINTQLATSKLIVKDQKFLNKDAPNMNYATTEAKINSGSKTLDIGTQIASTTNGATQLIQYMDRSQSLINTLNYLRDTLISLLGWRTNGAQGKNEKATTAEVNSVNELGNHIKNHDLQMRMENIEKINEKWGLNISIKKYEEELEQWEKMNEIERPDDPQS